MGHEQRAEMLVVPLGRGQGLGHSWPGSNDFRNPHLCRKIGFRFA